METKMSKQIVGNVGMYYVCYQLSRMGLNVMPTARNAKGIDVVAYSEDGGKYIGLQVKTLSKPSAIPLGKSNVGCGDSIWCVVVGRKDGEWDVFVMTQDEIHNMAHQDRKHGWWVEFKKFGKSDEFKNRWERIATAIGQDANARAAIYAYCTYESKL